MTPRILLFDLSALSFQCFFPAEQAHKANPEKYDLRQVFLFNLDRKIDGILKDVGAKPEDCIFVKDGKDPVRKQLLPKYKSNRPKRDVDPRPWAIEHLLSRGFRVMWSATAEADDAIASLAQGLCAVGQSVVVVSPDKDLWALWAPPRVRIYLPTKGKWLTLTDMESKLGVSEAKHVHLVKTLWGDPSDCIPNLAPRLQKTLMPLVKCSDGTLNEFFARVQNVGVSTSCYQTLRKNWEQIETNYKVVQLRTDCEVVDFDGSEC